MFEILINIIFTKKKDLYRNASHKCVKFVKLEGNSENFEKSTDLQKERWLSNQTMLI